MWVLPRPPRGALPLEALPPGRTMVVPRLPLLEVQLALSTRLSSSQTQSGCRATLPQRLQRPAQQAGGWGERGQVCVGAGKCRLLNRNGTCDVMG